MLLFFKSALTAFIGSGFILFREGGFIDVCDKGSGGNSFVAFKIAVEGCIGFESTLF